MKGLRYVSAAAFVVGSLVYLAAETIAAARWESPSYSYSQNWISDLGSATTGVFQGRELDSPLHAVMNAGFIVQGLLFGLATVLLSRIIIGRSRFTAVMGVVIAVGYVLVATSNADVPSGAIERGSVYPIVLWQLVVAVALLRGVTSSATGHTDDAAHSNRT